MGVEAGQPVRAGGLLYAGGPVLTASRGETAGAAFNSQVLVTDSALYQVEKETLVAYEPKFDRWRGAELWR